jgi:hypothetical protein
VHPDDQIITLEPDTLDHRACDTQQARPYSGLAHAVSSTNPDRLISIRDRIRSGVRRNFDQLVRSPTKGAGDPVFGGYGFLTKVAVADGESGSVR